MRLWTSEEVDILVKKFPFVKTQEIATQLNRSYGTVAHKAAHMGLQKSEAFRNSDLSGRGNLITGKPKGYRKGIPAHNKGKKMTPEHRAKCEHTFFKKGHPQYRYNKYPKELREAIYALGKLKRAIKQNRKKMQI